MRLTLTLMAVSLVVAASGPVRAEVIEEDFDAGAERWEAVRGEWTVEDGMYVQTDASSPDYRLSVFDTPLDEGAIEAVATPLERNDHGNVGTTFGLVVKYVDDDRWCAARFGSYGSCSLLIRRPGDNGRISLGSFHPEPGRSYHARVLLRNDMLAITHDGLVVAILDDPFPDQAGRPGLFTETRCRFDDVRIEVTEQ